MEEFKEFKEFEEKEPGARIQELGGRVGLSAKRWSRALSREAAIYDSPAAAGRSPSIRHQNASHRRLRFNRGAEP